MAGLIDVLERHYLGVRICGDTIAVDPLFPPSWGRCGRAFSGVPGVRGGLDRLTCVSPPRRLTQRRLAWSQVVCASNFIRARRCGSGPR
jgi:hypothetical protein